MTTIDPAKPNHFANDNLGDPYTCTGDHNHPDPSDRPDPWAELAARVDALAELTARMRAELADPARIAEQILPEPTGRDPVVITWGAVPDPTVVAMRRQLAAVWTVYTEDGAYRARIWPQVLALVADTVGEEHVRSGALIWEPRQ